MSAGNASDDGISKPRASTGTMLRLQAIAWRISCLSQSSSFLHRSRHPVVKITMKSVALSILASNASPNLPLLILLCQIYLIDFYE